MEAKKVFIRPDNTAMITCPECQSTRTVSLDKIPKGKQFLKIKCSCANVFEVKLEFRKFYRKDTNLYGTIKLLAAKNPKKPVEAGGTRYVCSVTNPCDCKIVNVSKTGVGINMPGRHEFEVGDTLLVEFNLDDAKKSRIEKKLVIRLVRDKFLGCEFIAVDQYDKALGFYLL